MMIKQGQAENILSSQVAIMGPGIINWFTVAWCTLPYLHAGDLVTVEWHGHAALHVVPFDDPGTPATQRVPSSFTGELVKGITLSDRWVPSTADDGDFYNLFKLTGHNTNRDGHYDEIHITTNWLAPKDCSLGIQLRLRSRVSNPD